LKPINFAKELIVQSIKIKSIAIQERTKNIY
jgi:hypothetical protein